jgi:hypothetical protein
MNEKVDDANGEVISSDLRPLKRKAYGSIPHLPNSRTGPGDHHIPEGQTRICTERARPGDTIIVRLGCND